MRLTSFTDFGLRALMRMASPPMRAYSTAELAAEFEISRYHLAKIITTLAQAGLIATRRGSGGGAQLSRDPSQIRLGDVVRVLETGQPLVACSAPDGFCTLSDCCRLKGRLRAAEAAFLDELDRSTLADVALAPPRARRRPQFPTKPAKGSRHGQLAAQPDHRNAERGL